MTIQRGKKAEAAATKAGETLKNAPPVSPNPMTNLILTDLLLRTGGQLMRRTVEHALLQTRYDKNKAKNIIKGRSLTQTLVATAIARMATRSVPGARSARAWMRWRSRPPPAPTAESPVAADAGA